MNQGEIQSTLGAFWVEGLLGLIFLFRDLKVLWPQFDVFELQMALFAEYSSYVLSIFIGLLEARRTLCMI